MSLSTRFLLICYLLWRRLGFLNSPLPCCGIIHFIWIQSNLRKKKCRFSFDMFPIYFVLLSGLITEFSFWFIILFNLELQVQNMSFSNLGFFAQYSILTTWILFLFYEPNIPVGLTSSSVRSVVGWIFFTSHGLSQHVSRVSYWFAAIS